MDTGDTAWVLASTALVMLMTPGLAFFYGGMVRRKSVLNMLMMSFICLGVVTVLWGIAGYGLAFGSDLGAVHGPGLLGTPDWLLHQAGRVPYTNDAGHTIPTLAFAMFQLMFAVLTVALISGAVAERVRFGPWMLFAALWAVVVYFPIAHWVFDSDTLDSAGNVVVHGGWLHNNPIFALDFAGGTTVHMNAGAAGLALALVVGPRRGWPQPPSERPWPRHNIPSVLLGASLLWFGWYGFNAGSALGANSDAATAFTNTTLATAVAVLGWLFYEAVLTGGSTYSTVSAASGAVAGLVAITPACAYVSQAGALLIGLVAGVGCAAFVGSGWKTKLLPRDVDDSLDVVGVHLIGGLIGTILVGFLATHGAKVRPNARGMFYDGGFDQLWRQAVAAAAVLAYSFIVTWLLGKLVDRLVPGGLRVSAKVELEDTGVGVDRSEHGERAYDDVEAHAPVAAETRV